MYYYDLKIVYTNTNDEPTVVKGICFPNPIHSGDTIEYGYSGKTQNLTINRVIHSIEKSTIVVVF